MGILISDKVDFRAENYQKQKKTLHNYKRITKKT